MRPSLALILAALSSAACTGQRGRSDPSIHGPDPVPLVAEPAPAPMPIAIAPPEAEAPPPTEVAAPPPSPTPAVAVSPPALPPALARATPWVHRRLSTGLAPQTHVLSTYRLYRAGKLAALVQEERTSTAPGERRDLSPWSPVTWVVAYVGTVAPAGRRQRLTLRSVDERGPEHGYELQWLCTPQRTRVAGPRAVRVPMRAPGQRPEGAECDGDPGRWSPARTRAIATLTCEPVDQPEDGITLIFAPGPGVEHVAINDDCDMQGDGLRQASPDDTIAPVRP